MLLLVIRLYFRKGCSVFFHVDKAVVEKEEGVEMEKKKTRTKSMKKTTMIQEMKEMMPRMGQPFQITRILKLNMLNLGRVLVVVAKKRLARCRRYNMT